MIFLPQDWVRNGKDCEEYRECSEIFWIEEVGGSRASHMLYDEPDRFMEWNLFGK
jgi:hypothetical protein